MGAVAPVTPGPLAVVILGPLKVEIVPVGPALGGETVTDGVRRLRLLLDKEVGLAPRAPPGVLPVPGLLCQVLAPTTRPPVGAGRPFMGAATGGRPCLVDTNKSAYCFPPADVVVGGRTA